MNTEQVSPMLIPSKAHPMNNMWWDDAFGSNSQAIVGTTFIVIMVHFRPIASTKNADKKFPIGSNMNIILAVGRLISKIK